MTAVGQYRHRVTVEEPTTVPDPDGGYIETWAPLDPPTWDCALQAASLRDLERVSGGAVETTATHLAMGRYHGQLSASARIRFRDRTFEIQSVHDRDQRQIEIICVCREITSAAEGPTRDAGPPRRPAREMTRDGRPIGH